MVILIPCPKCGMNLRDGILSRCQRCAWELPPGEKQRALEEHSVHLAKLVGRLHGSRVNAWLVAGASVIVNLLLVAVLVILLRK